MAAIILLGRSRACSAKAPRSGESCEQPGLNALNA